MKSIRLFIRSENKVDNFCIRNCLQDYNQWYQQAGSIWSHLNWKEY
ncbi:MAG: hypothetical protein IPP43_12715 [Chitinophagaceae bacterium]|nr:hypothetical protein [Chitinophagaceae bacterium]